MSVRIAPGAEACTAQPLRNLRLKTLCTHFPYNRGLNKTNLGWCGRINFPKSTANKY